MLRYNLTKISSIIVLGIGITVLVGWFLDIDILKSLLPTLVTMKFSTALSFAMGGMILYFINESEKKNSEYAKIFLLTPMIVILFFMMTLLVSTFAGISTGIQDIFVKEELGAIKSVAPGIPSVGTMINFLLIYAASIIVLLNLAKKKKILTSIAYAITFVGSLAVIGYSVNVELFYYTIEGFSTAMALHTAISFIIIGIGMLFITKGNEIINVTSSHRISIKSKVLLIILPGTIATLVLMATVNHSFAQNEVTEQTIRELEYLQIPVIVAISFLAIHASLFFEKSISNPILKIRNAFNEISKGNLDVKIDVVSNDEIKDLARAVNEMTTSLKKTIELEKQLVRAEENIKKERFVAIGELAGNLAHDIRNPLSSIINSADLMKMENPKPTEQFDKSFSRLKAASSRIDRQVNDIMDFLRTTPLQIEKKSIQHILKSVFNNLNVPTNITVNISSEDLEIECDRVKLESVFTNIVFNAIQSIDDSDGSISIDLNKNEDDAVIEISNTGPVITVEALPRLFEPLYTTKYKGTGLGLASCKNIIDLHQGAITVTPDPVSFKIKIPLKQPQNN